MATKCPVPKARWRRGCERGWIMDVGPHQYTVLYEKRSAHDFISPLVGDDGPWIYDCHSFRTLKQAKCRAEDDALDRLRKEAADLGLLVAEESRR